MTVGESPDVLTPEETILLVDALDHLIHGPRIVGEAERPDLRPYEAVRARLKRSIRMSVFDRAHRWLESELREERIAVIHRLIAVLYPLLSDPAENRRTIKEKYRLATQELRDGVDRLSTERPGVW